MSAKPKYQNQTGLFSEHKGARVEQGPHERVRLTIPAREALQGAGAKITAEPNDESGAQLYTVELTERTPENIIAVRILNTDHTGLRTSDEPKYPGEVSDGWLQLDFTPCPKCGAPLVWYEAGYVPGYRVCAKKPHHHVL